MRKRKSFMSLLLTALAVFVLLLGTGFAFSLGAVAVNAAWTNDGGVDHYTDMTSNGEDLEYYDTLYNEDWTLYNGSNQSLGTMPKEWTIANDQYMRFTPSASNTTGSFVWSYTYTCTDAGTSFYVYPLSDGAWNGADPFDYHSCGFEAGKTYEVEFGVVKVKNNDNYYLFVKVDGVFKAGTYRAASAQKGNDLYFYIQGGAGKAVSNKPISYETYDTLYNVDLGLSESWALKDDTYVSFTPSSENTTGSFVWVFEYTCTTAGTINIYPLAGGSWPSNGNSTVFNLDACGFTAGNTYAVELGVLKVKDSSDYQIYVTVNDEEKINVTRDESLKQGNGLYFYVVGAAGTLVSESPAVVYEYEEYQVIQNDDLGLPATYTVPSADATNGVGFTNELTTASFVYKFNYTPASANNANMYLRSSYWGSWMFAFRQTDFHYGFEGNTPNASGEVFTVGNTHTVELGVIDIKDSDNTWVFVKVDGVEVVSTITATTQTAKNISFYGNTASTISQYSYEVSFNGEAKEVLAGQAIGELPEAPEQEGEIFVSWTDQNGNTVTENTVPTSDLTLTANYQINFEDSKYADYVSVQNDDMGMSNPQETTGDGAAFAYTPIASGNNSVVYTYTYANSIPTGTHAVVLQGNNWTGNGYAFFIQSTQIIIGAEDTGNKKSVSVTYGIGDKIELGAINYANETKVHLYVKINDVLIGEDVVASRDTVAGIFTWNAAYVAQYSWNVTFTGVETREVLVGQAIGVLPDLGVNAVWTDQNGNEVTIDTVPTCDIVATTDAKLQYVIKDESGNDIVIECTVGQPVEYDGYEIWTQETKTFIGYLVGDALYQDLNEAITASEETGKDVVIKTVTLGILDGASIRLGGSPSIRFTATVGIADSEYAKVLDFGILMTTDEVRKTLSDFTIAGLSGADSSLYYNYNKNSGNLRYVENEDYANQYLYSLVLEKVSKSHYGVKYTARAYVLVEYVDGTQAYVYGEFDAENHIRSMYDVASAAIADEVAGYTDTQKTVIQKYIDGIIDLNAYLELQGRERNYTVSVSDIDVNGYYTVSVTPNNGFDITGIGAIYVEGVKVAVSSADVSAGTFKISESEMSANVLAAFENAMAEKEDLRALQISAYSGPSLGVKQTTADTTVAGGYVTTYEDLKTYMAAGFDAWYVDVSCLSALTGYTAQGTTYQGDTPTYDVYRALDLAAQYANETGKPCPVYINIPHLTDMVMDEVESGKTWIRLIYDIFTNYNDGLTTASNSPVNGINQIGGFMLHDEPTLADYDAFAAAYNEIAYTCGAIEAGYDFSCALLQTYAGTDKIGDSYSTYVNKYATLMQDTGISFDNYPFYYVSEDGLFSSSSENLMEDSWYSDMQAVRANENGTGTCIQSYTAGAQESGWLTKTTKYKNIDKEAEISMQVYTALAYGFTELDYFVYWDTMNREMKETAGETGEVFQKTPIMWNDEDDWSKGHYQSEYYGWIKNTNAEAKGVFEVLRKFTSTGVQLLSGTNETSDTFGGASSTNTINAANVSADFDVVVGGFKTVDGMNGYLAVSVDPPDNENDGVTTVFDFDGFTKAIVYVDGEAKVMRIAKDGTLSLKIGCGEGVFIVPIA